MTKMVIIAYNEAIDAQVMGALAACNLKNYTRVSGAFGRGNSSGTHLGDDIWPGRNNILYVACAEEESRNLLAAVQKLKQELSSEGIKAFVLPIEAAT